MSSKSENKKGNELDLSIERILEINQGCVTVQDNDSCPHELAFRLGLFKVELERYVKVHNEAFDKLNRDYRKHLKAVLLNGKETGEKEMPDKHNEQLIAERKKLSEKIITGVKVTRFKLSDFEDVEGITPVFFTFMADLVTE